MGDYRWLLVRLPDSKEFWINLDGAKTTEQPALVGRQAGLPLFSIDTDDCLSEYRARKERGVGFGGEPEVPPYSTGTLMKDPTATRSTSIRTDAAGGQRSAG
jgi:hypothetical protein